MGWVSIFCLLVLLQPCSFFVTAQLWGPEPWEPERRAKSLAFLGRDEGTVLDGNSVTDTKDEDDKQKEEDAGGGSESDKKAILNVSDKDSPYALIDKYFPERESYFYQNRNKFLTEYKERGNNEDKFNDIGDLDPSEVWLSDDSLLVLKGGSTPNRDGFDNPWRPIDDFEAPYREPVLPPPDFDPDTLDIGVGVPIETILADRARQEKLSSVTTTTLPPRQLSLLPPPDNSLVSFSDEFERSSRPDPLQPFKDEVDAGHQEFKQFLDDVSKFISDMENFHSVKKQSASKALIRTLPPPSPTTPTTARVTFSTPRSSTSYPISYSSPHGKVFLSTNYISHTPPPITHKVSTVSSTFQPHRQHARSTRFPLKTSPSPPTSTLRPSHSTTQSLSPNVSTIQPIYKERGTTTTREVIPWSRDQEQEEWTPVTSPPSVGRKYNREDEFKLVVKQLPAKVTPAPVRHSIKPSGVAAPTTTPRYSLQSPTPYSLFQSVPENFQETDVFHLSQNVDFGKKLGVEVSGGPISRSSRPYPAVASISSVAYNEVDTGNTRQKGPPSKKYNGRYSVSVTTKPPKMRHHKAPPPPPPPPAVSLDNILPAIFTGTRSRSRSTIRRRRPKYLAPAKASDRQGNGDVRYVSFFSGGHGGNSWGYSYNLG